jgi:hypothetical protein
MPGELVEFQTPRSTRLRPGERLLDARRRLDNPPAAARIEELFADLRRLLFAKPGYIDIYARLTGELLRRSAERKG